MKNIRYCNLNKFLRKLIVVRIGTYGYLGAGECYPYNRLVIILT